MITQRLILVALAVAATFDVLISLKVRSQKGWKPLVVTLMTKNSANLLEGTVRCLLLENFKLRGMALEIRAKDLGSHDETLDILALLERDGVLSLLSPADVIDPEVVVLNLQDESANDWARGTDRAY